MTGYYSREHNGSRLTLGMVTEINPWDFFLWPCTSIFSPYLFVVIVEVGTPRDLIVFSWITGVSGISRSRGYKHVVSAMGNDT